MKTLILTISLCMALPHLLPAQESEAVSTNKVMAAPAQELSQELVRSFLHLQEQVHATQLAVERSRFEAEAAAARNSEALSKRLEMLEKSLAAVSKENTTAIVDSNRQIQESNSRMTLLAGIFALVGFLALALTGWLQWRVMSHLSGYSSVGFPAQLPHRGLERLALGSQTDQVTSVQLRKALGKLEHRIAEVEGASSHGSRSLSAAPLSGAEEGSATAPKDAHSSTEATLASLIKEGEEMLAHEEAEKAIEHFDAVLAKHPGHPEVLLYKGTALERLRRDQEAIECYNLAIHADKNLTMAYLHKGGLFNRMERFSEAMECYEQALRIQEGRPAA